MHGVYKNGLLYSYNEEFVKNHAQTIHCFKSDMTYVFVRSYRFQQ